MTNSQKGVVIYIFGPKSSASQLLSRKPKIPSFLNRSSARPHQNTQNRYH